MRTANSSPEAICEHRWWSLAELETTPDVVFPEGLAAALASIPIMADGDAA